MEHTRSSDDSHPAANSGIKTSFLLTFILVVGLGAVNFGY